MAELHILGQIVSAENFNQSSLFCKWSFHADSGWKLISGSSEGQSQECSDVYTKKFIWDHPLDLHYTAQSLQGSPKLLLQIFCRNSYDRVLFVGYGLVTVPLTPGLHCLKCHTWKPVDQDVNALPTVDLCSLDRLNDMAKNDTIFNAGSWQDRLKDRFLGMTLQLKNPSLLANGDDRFELLTESMGTVDVHLHIIAKNFSKFGCEL